MLMGIAWRIAPLSALLLAGCASTNPGSGAGIYYKLPKTVASAKLTVYLDECGSKKGEFKTRAEVEVLGEPAADDANLFYVHGSALASYRTKRALQINVSDDGVLSGVNATNADQSPAILGSVLKTISIIAPMAFTPAGGTPDKDSCAFALPKAQDALEDITKLKDGIKRLRSELDNPNRDTGSDARKIREINRLALRIVTIREQHLKIVTTAQIDLGHLPKLVPAQPIDTAAMETARKQLVAAAAAGDKLAWETGPFAKWAKDGDTKKYVEFVTREISHRWTGTDIVPAPIALHESDKEQRGSPNACKLEMHVANVSDLKIEVRPINADNGTPGEAVAEKVVHLAQWNTPAQICLDVAFGEARNVGLKFDKFGRTNEFIWSSEATGATVAGAISGYATDAAAIATGMKSKPGPTELEKQKAEIDALETQQKLNQLKACEEIIKAGGYTCETT